MKSVKEVFKELDKAFTPGREWMAHEIKGGENGPKREEHIYKDVEGSGTECSIGATYFEGRCWILDVVDFSHRDQIHIESTQDNDEVLGLLQNLYRRVVNGEKTTAEINYV